MGLTDTALAVADGHRREVSPGLDEDGRKRLGQFMTPTGIARMLAGHFVHMPSEVRLLDAGAGMGALTAAFVEAACNHPVPPRSIAVTCYEVDPDMVAILRETLARCATDCARAGIAFQAEVVADDYILRSAEPLLVAAGRFNCAILNPPYGKINAGSKWRAALRSQGIETVNLYTAFVALALQQLEPGGELVAITPRSFCNGSYYEPFRRLMLDLSALLAIHVFESRRSAFRDDDVLQENVIFHLRRGCLRTVWRYQPRGCFGPTASTGPWATCPWTGTMSICTAISCASARRRWSSTACVWAGASWT